MGDNTHIQWTDASWNPSTGCDKISPGCRNCYAERMATRLQAMGQERYKAGFQLTLHEEALTIPLKWHEPRRIFVDSMSDLFHKNISDEFLLRCFATMQKADWHVFQVLTKRADRMADFIRQQINPPPPHVWLGVSVEDRKYGLPRIEHLKRTPSNRFLSIEPLLEDLGEVDFTGIHWVIIGGESGPGARPMRLEWVRPIIEQCRAAGASVFVKQLGAVWAKENRAKHRKGDEPSEWPKDVQIREFPASMRLTAKPTATQRLASLSQPSLLSTTNAK